MAETAQTAKTEFIMLSTPELIQTYWNGMTPHIQRYIDEATDGELLLEDIYAKLAAMECFAFIVKTEDNDVELAIVAEAVQYPRLNVLNIIAIGGHDLKTFYSKYWNVLAGWAHLIGFRAIEGQVAEGMARLMAPMGFEKKSVLVRAPTLGD